MPFYLAVWLDRHELAWMALGGWLGTLVDPGGLRSTRAKTMSAFALIGGVALGVSESLAQSTWLAAFGLMLVAFPASLLRSLGAVWTSAGDDGHDRGRHRQCARRLGARRRRRLLRPGCGPRDPAVIGDLADLDAFAAAPRGSQRFRRARTLRVRDRSLPTCWRPRGRSSLERARARPSPADSQRHRRGAPFGARRSRAACRRNPHRQQLARAARLGRSAVSIARHPQRGK